MVSVAIAFGAGCDDNPVGRLCDLGASTPTVDNTVVASPSLDCVSRTCLHFTPDRTPPPGSNPQPLNSGLCTAECSMDSDCERVPESPCVTGFTCAIATTAGDFCCKKFCICKDYITLPQTVQEQCNASNPLAMCCNLAGRANNPMYSLCKS
ncbi:MAG TPA: hypothetical protein VHW23_46085 [Kofleriaceae bacterium]|nr:hypothetical protein [Kofleriaceae bacterium]